MFKRLAVIMTVVGAALALIACGDGDDKSDNTSWGQESNSGTPAGEASTAKNDNADILSLPDDLGTTETALQVSTPPPITVDNVSQIRPLARLGPGGLYDIGLLDGGQMLAAVAENGIGLYQADDLTPIDFLDYEQDPFGDDWPGPGPGTRTSSLKADFAGSTVSFVWEEQQWTIDVMTGEQRVEPAPVDYEEPEPTTVSPDGQWEIITEHDPQTYRKIFTMQNTQTGAEWDLTQAVCGGYRQIGFGSEFSPDGTRLYTATGPMNGVVSAWNLETGEIVATVGGFGTEVWDLAFDQQGRLLVVQGEQNPQTLALYCPGERNPGSGIFAYDLASGTSTRLDLPGVDYPYRIAVSADGRVMVVKEITGRLTVWENGEQVAAYDARAECRDVPGSGYEHYPTYYFYYAVSSDGAYIAAMNWKEVVVWDRVWLRGDEHLTECPGRLDHDDPRLVFELHVPDQVWDMLYLPTLQLMAFDGTTLVFADFGPLRFVDVPAGSELDALEFPSIITTLALSNHTLAIQVSTNWFEAYVESMVAAGMEVTDEEIALLRERYGIPENPTVSVWQLGDGESVLVNEFEATADWLTLSPDGTLLVATGMGMESMSFFEVATGRLLREIESVARVPPVFSPDGSALIIAPHPPKRSIEVWGIPAE
jgi:WD40 repeat protein